MDNTKEYIVCAAYLFREGYVTPNVEKVNEQTGGDVRDIYYQPHRQVFNMALGWRHADILYKYGDCIRKNDLGGFMTSKGRYVDRKEAAEIAYACRQIENKVELLFSEDIY